MNRLKVAATALAAGALVAVPAIAEAVAQPAQPAQPARPAPAPQAATAGPTGVAGKWTKKFADEFGGTKLAGTWTPGWFGSGVTAPINGDEQACYDSRQVSLPGDGALHLKASARPSTCDGKTKPNTGSLVNSNGKFHYRYGLVEWRAYIPPSGTHLANWPALWSNGENWPTDGENDTMEGLGGNACFHFHSPSGGPGNCAAGNLTGWHTFASDWEPGSVTYYYDGVKVGRISSGVTSSPQYLIMNHTVSSALGGPTVLPGDMKVDYVRVWQH
ncbi:glycoside hydrolase family 16 protein [Streptomyces lydicus]|uniref:glycoside hydrolase family 16 protein n=1 Tax=Streptomyces lydicus TaxID=47763 RepID=UPI0037B4B0CA